tara:strand:+ start:4401 stop:5144 length:744 start_codon:yes stop_codon:yes gene_type:complete
MNFKVIIPARYNSTRLPGKLLLDVGGKPLIWHTYQVAKKSTAEEVIIATDDQRIADVARSFGATVCTTSQSHKSGTDRIAEVVTLAALGDEDIIVNLQGDEPLIDPKLIDLVALSLSNNMNASASTLACPVKEEQIFDSNVVKVVINKNKMALYFSRAPIPWKRGKFEDLITDKNGMLRHIGIYAYRVKFLKNYADLKQPQIEDQESLEQLRIIWAGEKILVETISDDFSRGIDTEEDYQELLKIIN